MPAEDNVYSQAGARPRTAAQSLIDQLYQPVTPLSTVRPHQASDQYNTGWQGTAGSVSMLFSKLAEGIGEGRVQAVQQQEAQNRSRLKMIEDARNEVINNPSASEESIRRVNELYRDALVHATEPAKGQDGKGGHPVVSFMRDMLMGGTAGLKKPGKVNLTETLGEISLINRAMRDEESGEFKGDPKFSMKAMGTRLVRDINQGLDSVKGTGPNSEVLLPDVMRSDLRPKLNELAQTDPNQYNVLLDQLKAGYRPRPTAEQALIESGAGWLGGQGNGAPPPPPREGVAPAQGAPPPAARAEGAGVPPPAARQGAGDYQFPGTMVGRPIETQPVSSVRTPGAPPASRDAQAAATERPPLGEKVDIPFAAQMVLQKLTGKGMREEYLVDPKNKLAGTVEEYRPGMWRQVGTNRAYDADAGFAQGYRIVPDKPAEAAQHWTSSTINVKGVPHTHYFNPSTKEGYTLPEEAHVSGKSPEDYRVDRANRAEDRFQVAVDRLGERRMDALLKLQQKQALYAEDTERVKSEQDALNKAYDAQGELVMAMHNNRKSLIFGQPPTPLDREKSQGVAQANNNPFNMKRVDESWEQFDSMEEGWKAGLSKLNRWISGKNQLGMNKDTTLSQMITKWAPPDDGNPTQAYINFVASRLGVKPDVKIGALEKRVEDLGAAMVRFETGSEDLSKRLRGATGGGGLSDEQFERVIGAMFPGGGDSYNKR